MNPLSPERFRQRLSEEQLAEGRRREAFGGGEEELTTFTDEDGITSKGLPDGPSVKCCMDIFEPPETVEFRGAMVEVVDPDPLDARSREILNEIAAIRNLNARVQTETFEDVAQEVFDEAFNLMVARQRKYGPGNIETLGQYGVFTRMEDKMERIRRSFNGTMVAGQLVLDDPVEHSDDTLDDADLDLMNYAAIRLIHRRGKWGKPLIEEVEARA